MQELMYDKWMNDHEPLGCSVVFDDERLETYGDDMEKVERQMKENPNHVWTAVEGDDGKLYVLAGYHHVNRLHHFITKKPWTNADLIVIDD